MKRIFLILLILALAASAWAAPIKLTLVNTGFSPWPEGFDTKGYQSFQHLIVGEFQKAHPDIQVTMIARDVTQGSLTVDALMAKGTPPDVWLDAGGYFVKYINAAYALPLEKYLDTGAFMPDLVAPYSRDGHVYALPTANISGAMAVNLDMLKQIGYSLPALKAWTTDEFLRLAAKLKAAGLAATMVMTQQGMITWDVVWLFAFGAQMYKNYDHSRTTINSPEAVKGLEYMKALVDKGYAWPHPNEVNDDMGVDLFTTGKVATCMMQNGHTDYWIPEQVKNGKLAKEFELTFTEFPHAPGREHTPIYGYQTAVIAHASKDEARNKAAALLLDSQVNKAYQDYEMMITGAFPTLKGLEPPNKGTAAKPSYKAIARVAAVAGMMDLNAMDPRAEEINRAWKEPTQAFMDGKITAQQLLSQVEKEANAILER